MACTLGVYPWHAAASASLIGRAKAAAEGENALSMGTLAPSVAIVQHCSIQGNKWRPNAIATTTTPGPGRPQQGSTTPSPALPPLPPARSDGWDQAAAEAEDRTLAALVAYGRFRVPAPPVRTTEPRSIAIQQGKPIFRGSALKTTHRATIYWVVGLPTRDSGRFRAACKKYPSPQSLRYGFQPDFPTFLNTDSPGHAGCLEPRVPRPPACQRGGSARL